MTDEQVEAWRSLWQRFGTPARRPSRGQLAAYALFVLVGVGGMWRVETTAHEARHAATHAQEALQQIQADRLLTRERACLKDDENNAKIRRMARDAPLELGEALIDAVTKTRGHPPAQGAVDQFRQIEARRLQGITNQLPAYRWEPRTGTCIEIPLDTGG